MNKNKGFTLIELILYVGITSFVLTAVVLFLALMLETQTKNRTIMEVNQQGTQIVQIINQAIHNAVNINSPALGLSGDRLSLGMNDSLKDPTIFEVNSDTLWMDEGTNSYALTNSKVSIVNLIFKNRSKSSTPGIISFEFTLSHVNPDNREEFDYTKTFSSSASLH
jgi:type II secretory pathway pseudopilin PulG